MIFPICGLGLVLASLPARFMMLAGLQVVRHHLSGPDCCFLMKLVVGTDYQTCNVIIHFIILYCSYSRSTTDLEHLSSSEGAFPSVAVSEFLRCE